MTAKIIINFELQNFFPCCLYLSLMKSLIRKILREQEEEIIQAPPFSFFRYDWNDVLDWVDGRLFRMNGDIDLSESDITTLGGLVDVGGDLNLFDCQNLQSLGELRSVGGDLDLNYCQNLQSLGELRSVGGYLDLSFSAIAKTMTDEEIRNQIEIKGLLFI